MRHIKCSLTKLLSVAMTSREGYQTLAAKAKGPAAKITPMDRHIVKIVPAALSKTKPTIIIEGINVKRAGRIAISDSNLCMICIELNKQTSKEISHKQTGKDTRDNLERICRGQPKVHPKRSGNILKKPKENKPS
jgi:hypothetical protein